MHLIDTDEGEELAGRKLARLTEWDGAALLRIMAHALEDANFHAEAQAALTMEAALFHNADSRAHNSAEVY
jgi:hypothetical protein